MPVFGVCGPGACNMTKRRINEKRVSSSVGTRKYEEVTLNTVAAIIEVGDVWVQ